MTASPRSAFGAQFVGAAGFLNSATFGLPPTFLMDALQRRLGDWQAGTLDVPSFDESVQRGRAAYAELVGVRAESVVMGGSVSAVLGLVASSVAENARVATLAGDFTSATFPFAAQAGRGVSVTEMTAEELIVSAADYDVVVASLVQSADGEVFDVDRLRAELAGAGTITVIDATQAVGWKELDLGWVDVTAAAVYKWLMAPRGTAWMSLSDRVARQMTPHLANWYAGAEPWSTIYGLPLRLADDARRFDTSPAWFGVLGAGLTLPWLASLDRAAVEAHCVGLAARLRAEFGLPPMASAIVSLPFVAGIVDHAADRLRSAGIMASVRAGGVRSASTCTTPRTTCSGWSMRSPGDHQPPSCPAMPRSMPSRVADGRTTSPSSSLHANAYACSRSFCVAPVSDATLSRLRARAIRCCASGEKSLRRRRIASPSAASNAVV